MKRPTLYLMVGYPGSGKTTTSHIIHDLTGAEHIWADHERHDMFPNPTHDKDESHKLYKVLNQRADELLSKGRSVIFDTNFNFRRDRDHLRAIARRNGALTKLIWIRIAKEVALERTQSDHHATRNKYDDIMPVESFERMTSHLEPPEADEKPIELDGANITPGYVAQKLGLLATDKT
jgi:predicted kinase